jgi:prepilin-type N-terminal cleavage/methylation domain-containing protein
MTPGQPIGTESRGIVGAWARRLHGQRGFTLVELLMVVGVMGVVMAIAIPLVGTAMEDARANTALRAVQGHLRSSRDRAIARRRVVKVVFSGTGDITSTILDGSNEIFLQTSILEYGMQFRLLSGVTDTPDAFGTEAAIDFDGATTTVYFQADGSLGDDTGLPVSGTVYLGVGGQTLSARAITIIGPTGRVQGYRWDGSAWRQQ